MMACGIAKGAICDWVDSNRILPSRVASYDSGTSTFLPPASHALAQTHQTKEVRDGEKYVLLDLRIKLR